MALLNYATREILFKVVYCGPAFSGKTTNMECLHSMIEPMRRGKLLSLWTGTDRMVSFDILPERPERPENKEKGRKFSVGFQLYTLPGRLRDEGSWKTVLKGADAIVFVADSQRRMRVANVQSLENMYKSLLSEKVIPMDIPVVLQFNKRDMDDILTTEELNADLNKTGYPYSEAVALRGRAVKETFQAVAKQLTKQAAKAHLGGPSPARDSLVRAGKAAPVMGRDNEYAHAGRGGAARVEHGSITAGETAGRPGKVGRGSAVPPKAMTLMELRSREAERSPGFFRRARLFAKGMKLRSYSLILAAVLAALFISYMLISGIQ